MYKKIFLFFLSFTALLLIWEIASRFFDDLIFILPSPIQVIRTLYLLHDRFWFHTLITFKEMCVGFLLALAIAFPLAWLMLRFKTARALLQPFFILIQCVPMFTLAPIMVIWFGWSFTAIVIPTMLMIFFPLTLNIYKGLDATPEEFLELFEIHEATPFQTFFKLRLPFALPHIFAGFRISAGIAGVGAVAGEWAGAQNGLGILMLESRRNTDLEITFGALFCLCAMTIFLYGCVLVCEKMLSTPLRTRLLAFRKWNIKLFFAQKESFALFLVLIALFFLLQTGCQKKVRDFNSVHLALDWLPNPIHVPLYAGCKKGFFEEENIHLTIRKMHESGSGIAFLTSKQTDLLINHVPGTLKAASRGAKIKIIGVLIKEPLRGFIYRKNSSIQDIAHLTGARLGYCIGGGDTVFLDFLLAKGNIIPLEKKNVSVDLLSAMATKKVDFIYGGFWNIEPFQLKALGIETGYFKIQELGIPSYYEMVILANEDTFYSETQFVKRFQKALNKSIQYCKNNPDEAFECYLAYNLDKTEKTILWEKESWLQTVILLTKDQRIKHDDLEEFALWQFENKIIEEKISTQELISS